MTRRSRRELERALEELGVSSAEGETIVLEETTIRTGWSDDGDGDAESGDVVDQETTRIEL